MEINIQNTTLVLPEGIANAIAEDLVELSNPKITLKEFNKILMKIDLKIANHVLLVVGDEPFKGKGFGLELMTRRIDRLYKAEDYNRSISNLLISINDMVAIYNDCIANEAKRVSK